MNPYATAAAFTQAVETRLRSSSSSGTDFARRRQLLVFDRFLARITRELGDSVILKGGLVVELRVERARTTKDIDLRLVGPAAGLLERLRRAAELELGDFMVFNVAPDADHPAITNEGMVCEGQRHRGTCTLAGKPYGQLFGLDIAWSVTLPPLGIASRAFTARFMVTCSGIPVRSWGPPRSSRSPIPTTLRRAAKPSGASSPAGARA